MITDTFIPRLTWQTNLWENRMKIAAKIISFADEKYDGIYEESFKEIYFKN